MVTIEQARIEFPMIPEAVLAELYVYMHTGHPPCPYLQAVLCNNLAQSYQLADYQSLRGLGELVMFLWNEAPAFLWGSPAAVKRHHESYNITVEVDDSTGGEKWTTPGGIIIRPAPITAKITVANILAPEQKETEAPERKHPEVRFHVMTQSNAPGCYVMEKLINFRCTGEIKSIQPDHDFPCLAESMGWVRSTQCGHADAIGFAIEYVDNHLGINYPDPGYFDAPVCSDCELTDGYHEDTCTNYDGKVSDEK